MSGHVLFGVALGLFSSVLFNTSYLLQHRALDGGPSLEFAKRPLQSIRELFTHITWLLGSLLGIVGMVVYIVALAYAPLSLVQAFLAGGLILTVPLAIVIGNHSPTRREWVGAGLMAFALVMFAFGSKAEGPTNDFDSHGLTLMVGGTVCIGLTLATLGIRNGPVAAVGLASGLFHGAADAISNAVVGIAHGGFMAVIKSPWTWSCVGVSLLAFYYLQKAFKDGKEKPVEVIALMTAATNLTAIGAGLLVFHDPLGINAFWSTVHMLAFGLVAIAGWLLATTQAVVEGGVVDDPGAST